MAERGGGGGGGKETLGTPDWLVVEVTEEAACVLKVRRAALPQALCFSRVHVQDVQKWLVALGGGSRAWRTRE